MNRFTISVREAISNTAVTVVDMEGTLDINTVEDFETALVGLFHQKRYKIVLNMEKLTYVSSAGFGVLLSIIKDVRKNRGDIKIAKVSPELYRTFDLLELPGMFQILKTEQDAVKGF